VSEKVCECIEEFRRFVSDTSDSIRFAMRHDFPKAIEYLREADNELVELEKCTGKSFEETRGYLKSAERALREYTDVVAEDRLKLAQWIIFREIRDKVCR